MDYYLGAIWSYGFNFPPNGTVQCNGQLMSIASSEALYALIGTTYGGDGTTTFGIPNLQGRVPIGTGQGPALPNYVIGQTGGSESVTLTTANLPAHTHAVLAISQQVSTSGGAVDSPATAYFGVAAPAQNVFSTTPNGLMANNTGTTSVTGSSIPLNILSPFLVINYCIATEGIFPSRN